MGAQISESFGRDRNFCTRMNPIKSTLLSNPADYTGRSLIRNGWSFLRLAGSGSKPFRMDGQPEFD